MEFGFGFQHEAEYLRDPVWIYLIWKSFGAYMHIRRDGTARLHMAPRRIYTLLDCSLMCSVHFTCHCKLRIEHIPKKSQIQKKNIMNKFVQIRKQQCVVRL